MTEKINPLYDGIHLQGSCYSKNQGLSNKTGNNCNSWYLYSSFKKKLSPQRKLPNNREKQRPNPATAFLLLSIKADKTTQLLWLMNGISNRKIKKERVSRSGKKNEKKRRDGLLFFIGEIIYNFLYSIINLVQDKNGG